MSCPTFFRSEVKFTKGIMDYNNHSGTDGQVLSSKTVNGVQKVQWITSSDASSMTVNTGKPTNIEISALEIGKSLFYINQAGTELRMIIKTSSSPDYYQDVVLSTLDTTAPTITINNIENVYLFKTITGNVYTIPGATTDDSEIQVVSSIEGGTEYPSSTIIDESTPLTLTPGNYTITYTAVDNAGNTNNVSQTLIVYDTLGLSLADNNEVLYVKRNDVNFNSSLYDSSSIEITDTSVSFTLDDIDISITNSAGEIISTITTNTLEDFTIIYSITHNDGTIISIQRTVRIVSDIQFINTDTVLEMQRVHFDNASTQVIDNSNNNVTAFINTVNGTITLDNNYIQVAVDENVYFNIADTYINAITYTATRFNITNSATRTLKIVDITNPEITNGNNPESYYIQRGSNKPTPENPGNIKNGITAQDEEGEDLTSNITFSSDLNNIVTLGTQVTYLLDASAIRHGPGTVSLTRPIVIYDTEIPKFYYGGLEVNSFSQATHIEKTINNQYESHDSSYLDSSKPTAKIIRTNGHVDTYTINVSGDIVDTSVLSTYTLIYTATNDTFTDSLYSLYPSIGKNSTININVGDTLELDVNVSGHPLWIKSTPSTGTSDFVTDPEAINNGATSGIISWTPNNTGIYYYVCQYHSTMVGVIFVSVQNETNETYNINVVPGSDYYSLSGNDRNGSVVKTISITQTFIVQDNIQPVLTLNGDSLITLNVGDPYIEQGATLTDIGDLGETTILNHNVLPNIGTVDTSTVGDYILQYNGNDGHENSAITIERTVRVESADPTTLQFSGPYQSTYFSPNDLTKHDVFLGTSNEVYNGTNATLSNDGKTIAHIFSRPLNQIRISTLNETNNEWELKTIINPGEDVMSFTGRISGDGTTFTFLLYHYFEQPNSIRVYKKNSNDEWVFDSSIDRPPGANHYWANGAGMYDLNEDGNMIVLNPVPEGPDLSPTLRREYNLIYQQDTNGVWNHISTFENYYNFNFYQMAQNGDIILAIPFWYDGYTMQNGCYIYKRQNGTNNWALLQNFFPMPSGFENMTSGSMILSKDGSTLVFGLFDNLRTIVIFKYDESQGNYQRQNQIMDMNTTAKWPTAYNIGDSFPDYISSNTTDLRLNSVSGDGKIIGLRSEIGGNKVNALHLLGLGSDGNYIPIFFKFLYSRDYEPVGKYTWSYLSTSNGFINLNSQHLSISKDGKTVIVSSEFPGTWPFGKVYVYHGKHQTSLTVNNVFESYGPYSGPMDFRDTNNFSNNEMYQISFELKIGSGLPSTGASIIYFETTFQEKVNSANVITDKILHIYLNSNGELIVDELGNNSTFVISNTDVNTYLVNGYYNTITYKRTGGTSEIILTKYDTTSNTYTNSISGSTFLNLDTYTKVLHIANNQRFQDDNLTFSFNDMYIRNIQTSNSTL